jgi:translation initiation factor 2 subunit 2
MEKIYDEHYLLERLFEKLEQNKPQRLIAVKPKSEKINRKTHVTNFEIFCNSVKRDINSVKNYIDEQLDKNSSISSTGVLIIDRIYHQYEIDKVFMSYITSYVLCSEPKCGSGNTQLIKENRLTYLFCNTCNCKKAL